MKDTTKMNLIKYGGCFVFVALLAWIYISNREFVGAERVEQYLILCDAFTVPGVILVMVGCLVWASTQGALDGLSYAMQYAIYSLIPGKRLEADETFGDYLERKRSKRAKGYSFLFISGAVTIIIALIFMGLYYSL